MNFLKDLAPYHTVGIIGMSKNAGKTTVLNAILKSLQSQFIALTSIGLDGEKVDTLSYREKPRIKVFERMIVATAKEALNESTAHVKILKTTDINTPLGPIVIAQITNDGNILLAGPSTNSGLKKVKQEFETLSVDHIFIDGALFRKSFATTELIDGVIVVSGASYSNSLKTLINDTASVVKSLTIPSFQVDALKETVKWALLDQSLSVQYQGETPLSLAPNNLNILKQIDCHYIQLNGAINDAFVRYCLHHRNHVEGQTLIVDDPVQILCSPKNLRYLETIGVKLVTRHELTIPFIAINPFDTMQYVFDPKLMKDHFINHFDYPIINVIDDKEDLDE